MGTLAGICAALLWCAAAPLYAAQQDNSQALFQEGVRRHQSGDISGAVETYRKLLERNPDHLEARSNLGAAYARLGDYAAAIEQYQRALELDPANAAVRFNLGLAFYNAARIREAAAEFSRVVTAQPDHRNAAVLLADCYLRMGENRKVIELLQPLYQTHTDDRALLYLLGTALIRDGQSERGQLLVDRILRAGDSAEARLMLGTARMMARDYRGALEEFERAVKLNPKLPSAHAYYGRALLATGDRDAAMEQFRRELALNPNDFDSNLYAGVLLKQEQKFDEALPHLERALRVRPGAPSVRYQIGSLYVSTGRLEEAQRILEELVREWPDFAEAHVSLATVYYRLKRKEDGDRHREIVRKLNAERQTRAPQPAHAMEAAYRSETAPAEPPQQSAGAVPAPETEAFDSLAARAASARENGRLADAVELYQKALALRPDWEEGWWYLGTIHYEEDRYREAREAFFRLSRLKPKGGPAWAMLGLCEYRLGRYEAALEHLQRARVFGLPANTELSAVSRFHLAVLLNKFGEHEAALQLLYALARREQESPSLIEAMGLSALRMTFLPGQVPADQSGLVGEAGWAQYLMATRRPEEARKAAEELVVRYPATPHLRYNLGVFLLAEDPDAAIEKFLEELRVSPQHVPARLQIAFEWIKRGDYGKALPYAEEAVRLDPRSFAARNALGRSLLETGQTDRAIRELEIGLQLAPDSPDMHFALARAYARAGRKQEAARARAEFQRLDRIRREALEGKQAVGGVIPERAGTLERD